MNGYDFNGADQQQSFELIPAGTIVPLVMIVKPGGAGDGGWYKPSKSSDAMMLDCEFIVTDGPYAKRKIFQNMVVSGGKQNDKGESMAGNITRATLRAMLESSRNVKPEDMSDTAVAKRRINGWQDFNGLCFVAKLKIEKGTQGYSDKNAIQTVITPDMKEYAPAPQVAAPMPAASATAPAAAAWGAAPASAQAPVQTPAWGTPPPAANTNPAPVWAQ